MKQVSFGPFKFYIDRPKGTVKKWPNKTFTYPCDYGYFKNTKAEDGEGLDAFVGDDPKGAFESFMKLNEDGTQDEMKFIVGVNAEDKSKIYKLYGKEISNLKKYKDANEMIKDVNNYVPNKKNRYRMVEIKEAAYKKALENFNVKNIIPEHADILTKINRGFERVDAKMDPTGSESSNGSLFQQDVM